MIKEKNEDNLNDPSNSGSKLKQYLATICVSLGAVCVGSILAWTSPVLPQLKPHPPTNSSQIIINATNSNITNGNHIYVDVNGNVSAINATLASDAAFTLTESEEGLVGAMLAIGALLAALPAGMLADRIGRRKTLLSLVVPFTVSWLCAIFATNVWWLYLCRLVAGAATSAMCVCAPMYIGEIAQARIRGQLGSCFQMFLCAGILLTYTLGSFLTWTCLSIALLFLPLIFFAAFFFMPETPVYLIKVSDRSKADKSLRYLRGQSAREDDVAEELLGIEVAVRKTTEGQQGRWGDLWEKRANRNALIAGLGVMIFQQLSGINSIIFYTASIFAQSGSSIPPSQASVILGFVQLLAGYASVMTVEKKGRRFFLTLSSIGMMVCLFVLGMYFHIKSNGMDVGSFGKRVHELRHGTDCPYLCFKCGLGFKSLYKRQVHERTHTGKQPFRCQYCGEKFESKYKKNLHEVGHISDTPYECRYCDESFKTQYRCKQHELAHSSDKPYQCQFCNESFKSSHKRYIHTLNHSGISHPYPCPRCSDRSVSFRTTYRLRAHLASVHRLRPDEMRDLVQAASERDAFVLASTSPTNYANAGSAGGGAGPVRGLDYLRRMQDDEVVTCFSCNAQFGNKIGLISHIRAQHTFTFL